MNVPGTKVVFLGAVGAGFFLLLCSGCVGWDTATYKQMLSYPPARAPVQIDASASVEAVSTLTPELRKQWRSYGELPISNLLQAEADILVNDVTSSELFARILPAGEIRSDYVIKIRSEESHSTDYRMQITILAIEAETGLEVSTHTRDAALASPGGNMANGIKPSLQQLMGALKADLAVDLQKYIRQRQQQAALKSETFLQNANLADLLASADKTELLARARNRALVAGKNQQLPAILRDKKTEELAALVVKIEQTILDLNHECEVAKDQAQQATAANGDARQTDELRGLAICYRERIELLKPILTALKEEIANRSR